MTDIGAGVIAAGVAIAIFLNRAEIVGVGGIMSGEDAKRMLDAGASLVEIYSGFIFEGPGLVKQILTYLETQEETTVNEA